jgi:hypothetical protein
MNDNCYYIAGRTSAFTDNRPGSTLSNAGLAAWKTHIGGDSGSIEVNPALDPVTYVATNPQCAGMGIPDSGVVPPVPSPTATPAATPTPSPTVPPTTQPTVKPSATPTTAPPSPTPTVQPTTQPTTPPAAGTTYNIADFYNKNGQLSVKRGDIIIAGQRQYRVLSNTYTISYWSQNSLNTAISWWIEYLDSYAAGGVVEVITGSTPAPTATPTTAPTTTTTKPAATPTPAPSPTVQPTTQPTPTPAPDGTTYNIADFYNKNGQLSVKRGDIIIAGQQQYKVLSNTYTISYWSQNSLNSAVTWWISYLDSFVDSGVVVMI